MVLDNATSEPEIVSALKAPSPELCGLYLFLGGETFSR